MPPTITPSLPLGILFHAIGATFAATCYTHQKKVKGWSWQTYWLSQALWCWLLLPIIGAALTIPDLMQVLHEAPRDAMLKSFLLGMGYGIGGTAFGIAIRYIGFSLTYAIAVGLSSVLGTLIPPLVHGTLVSDLSKPGGLWVITGVLIGTLGIALCGAAGRLKERDLEQSHTGKSGFNLTKGLLISILAGVLSAVYGFALDAGAPIAKTAELHGAGYWNGNVIYIFSNTGAFITTAIYCLYLALRHRTLAEHTKPNSTPEAPRPSLAANYLFSALTGLFWYGQFFFYNLGHVRMGQFQFTSWAIHMTMLVLISNVVGVVLREWATVHRATRTLLRTALAVLVGAVLLLSYGNYQGSQQTTPAPPKATPPK